MLRGTGSTNHAQIQKCPKLQFFIKSFDSDFGVEELELAHEALHQSAPHTIELRQCRRLHDSAVMSLTTINPNLQRLSLAGSAIGDASVEVICSAFTQLRALDLRSCAQVTEGALRILGASRLQLTELVRALHTICSLLC